ncbi:hypothetical protein D9613_004012 [Agrocybe pediades]|uniref:Uncharacterized protein n=1 Tax=Agrocybe pediades TaxID=84607 RepID=A0A8H4VJB2_9AGAR|nr:hypothetical protein D9613_004012 [Agrocybe pediades]
MMLGDSSKSQAKSKKITIARDINTGQPVFLVDLVPGAHLEVLATHDLPPTESYRSFYRKVVASNIWKRPSPVSSSESTTPTGSNSELLTSTTSSSTSLSSGDVGWTPGVDSAPSPSSTSTASSSTRTRKRKAGSGRNKNLDPNREIKRRRPRTQVTVPPSTRVLRADGPAV